MHLLIWQPFLLSQHLLANVPVFDVGVPERGFESDDRKLEGELFGEIDVEDKFSTLEWTFNRPSQDDLPMKQILLLFGYDVAELRIWITQGLPN